MKQILVVDDDPQIRALLQMALVKAEFKVQVASDGQAALDMARRDPPDLMILDIGLPEMDGLQVCQKLRQTQQTPVIFLTARDEEIDRILGFELGGDDYVTKPFSPRELIARVKAVLRRASTGAAPEVLRRGILTLQPTHHKCQIDGCDLPLTSTEMSILTVLMTQPDTPIARPRLTDRVYGANIHVSDRTLDSHLRNLRAKLAGAGCADAIETVHGVGVRMGPCSRA